MNGLSSRSPSTQSAFGGAKPLMLRTDSVPVLVSYRGAAKVGIYETNSRGSVLARRVELAPELSEFARIHAGSSSLLNLLLGARFGGAAGGHVFLRPGRYSTDGSPLVGVDVSLRGHVSSPRCGHVLFFVYRAGYRLHEIWKIPAADFLEASVLVQSSQVFEPQLMVPLSALKKTGCA